MRPWSLNLSIPQLETVSGCPILTLNWVRQGSAGDLHHAYSYKFAEPFDIASAMPVCQRLLSHLVLDELPDSALSEVLNFLGDVWLFHQPTPQPARESVRLRKGKVTRRYERPTYAIEE